MSNESPSDSRNRIPMLDGRHATAEEITAAAMQVEDALEDRERRKAVDAWSRDGVWMRRLALAAFSLASALGAAGYKAWVSNQDELAQIKTENALLKQRVEYLERAVAPHPYGVSR